MTRREYVLAAINHEQTDRIPYTLGFEGGTDRELDDYYGSTDWRRKVQPYLIGVGGVDSTCGRQIDQSHGRDAFGTIWRTDKLPWHLEKPGLSKPSFEGFNWPTIEQFPRYVAQNVGELTGPNADLQRIQPPL